MKKLLYVFILLSIASCSFTDSEDAGGTYVGPTIDRRGRFRKGYMRKNVSTSHNAVKNQNRSKYYYHTRGKYRKK